MFSRSLERTLRNAPDLQTLATRLYSAVDAFPKGQAVRPTLVARTLGADPTVIVAMLEALREDGLVDIGLRVLDSHDIEVRRFANVEELPASVVDEMGEVIELTPENVQVYFARVGE